MSSKMRNRYWILKKSELFAQKYDRSGAGAR